MPSPAARRIPSCRVAQLLDGAVDGGLVQTAEGGSPTRFGGGTRTWSSARRASSRRRSSSESCSIRSMSSWTAVSFISQFFETFAPAWLLHASRWRHDRTTTLASVDGQSPLHPPHRRQIRHNRRFLIRRDRRPDTRPPSCARSRPISSPRSAAASGASAASGRGGNRPGIADGSARPAGSAARREARTSRPVPAAYGHSSGARREAGRRAAGNSAPRRDSSKIRAAMPRQCPQARVKMEQTPPHTTLTSSSSITLRM